MSDPRSRRNSSANAQRITNSLNNQMAYLRRSSSFSSRRYGRRYSSYGRSAKRRSYGEARAARTNRDSSRQILKWSANQTVTINANAQEGSTSFNAWQALKNSGFYNLFAQMYDQIKLNAVHVKITLLAGSGSIYSATNNPVFVSAWDRNGITMQSSGGLPSVLTFSNVSSYGSAVTRPLTVGANFGVSRSIYASTMAEKSQYVSTSSLPIAIEDEETFDAGNYMAYPFKPCLLMALYTQGKASTSSEFVFNVEWSFDVTFRGTRNDPNAIEN